MASVLYETSRHVARITLNSPETGNTVRRDNLLLLRENVDKAIADVDIRVILLQGREGVFSRGAALKEIIDQPNLIAEGFTEPYLEAVLALRDSPKPVIAWIDGEVRGGGLGLVLACDIVLATPEATFGLPEVYWGIIPAYVFPLLLERVSYKRARSMVLSARTYRAEEAYPLGIVDEIWTAAQKEKALKNYCQRLLFASPAALARIKVYSDALFERKMRDSLEEAQREITHLLSKTETRQALEAFWEGEALPWSLSYKEEISDGPR